MIDVEALWQSLQQSAAPQVVASLKTIVESGSAKALNRINPIAFATTYGFSEEEVIRTFLHSARLGVFDLSWNMLCPGCGGVLETGPALKILGQSQYFCSLCAGDFQTTLDERVEVTFTINPRVRRIAAHEPHTLSLVEYVTQIFWGSSVEIPENVTELIEEITLDSMELGPGERAALSLTLPPGFVVIFDPVSHTTLFLDAKGEETRERRNVSIVFNEVHAHAGTIPMQPGPVRLSLENKSTRRSLACVWVAGETLHSIFGHRRPFLSATQLLSNQTFRDLYRTGTLDEEQRLKITSLTVLFTDLRGSTALYDRVGDLVAFDLVRSHFAALLETIAAEGGAVVKTMGDAVMATFPTPDRAVRAAMGMRRALSKLNEARGGEDLALNIGLHEGPCLAVMIDDRQDFFGQTVNVASRVQGLADPSAILVTKPIIENAIVARTLADAGAQVNVRKSSILRGVSEVVAVYEFVDAPLSN